MIDGMKTIGWITWLATCLWLSAAPVRAALPPAPGPIDNADRPTLAYIMAVILILAVAAISFKPAKRTHMD
jgi:hypothetical protein